MPVTVKTRKDVREMIRRLREPLPPREKVRNVLRVRQPRLRRSHWLTTNDSSL